MARDTRPTGSPGSEQSCLGVAAPAAAPAVIRKVAALLPAPEDWNRRRSCPAYGGCRHTPNPLYGPTPATVFQDEPSRTDRPRCLAASAATTRPQSPPR